MYIKDKYNMTKNENIFLAKRNIIGNIYNSVKLEGLDITFSDTYAIYYKARLEEVNIADVNTVLNLKHAWKYVLCNIDKPITLEYILDVHNEVAKDEAIAWGVLRNGGVGISGTDYRPSIPTKEEVMEKLKEFERIPGCTERSVERMLWMMKEQLFWDGNKRTAMLIANADMISHGKGIITIPEKDINSFGQLLSKFYSYDEKYDLKAFIFEKGIDGIVFDKEISHEEPVLE